MIHVIKPSPYNSVWKLDPGVPTDGTGASFDDPIVWQLHQASDDPTKCIYTAPNTEYFYILLRLEANVAYTIYIAAMTGPILYALFKQSDRNTKLEEFNYYSNPYHTFTVNESGNYILRGNNYYSIGEQEDVRIDPAPSLIGGDEEKWVVDKSRIQSGVWDENGILTGFRDFHTAEIDVTSMPKVPFDGLWAYYPLVKDFKDYSGNQRNLTVTGELTISKNNGVTGFNGSNYMSVSDYVSGINPRSICMWFKFIGTDSIERTMFCQGFNTSGSNFGLTRYDDNRLRAHTYGWSDTYTLTNKNNLHHLVVTYTQVGGTKRLMYVDGILVKEWSSSTNTVSTPMFFGIWANGTTIEAATGFTGYMSDIALYNRVLTADEVLQVYNAGNSLKG